MADIDISSYVVTDDFFGEPFIDIDEEHSNPAHRYIHGGFDGTATRFQLYFPPRELYKGRFFQPMMGGMGGMANVFGPNCPVGKHNGGYDLAVSLGGYMIEDNQGHNGKELCPKGGNDATIYGWRASAESARFARFLATQIYSEAPHHGYIYGGSGGALRSAQCIENVHDVWAGAMPVRGTTAAPPLRPGGRGGSAMFHGFRVLRHRIDDIVDAMEPGGSGNPFEKLNNVERQALYDLYRSGFPRGAERRLPHITGNIGSWAWGAEGYYAADPDYYDGFWTTPGFAGHDEPHLFADDLIVDTRVTVKEMLTSAELAQRGYGRVITIEGGDLANGAVIDPVDGYAVGCSVRVLTGKAAGRQLWCVGQFDGTTITVDGVGEAGNLRFDGVLPGDELEVDNRRFLAFTMRYRHLVDPNAPSQSHLAIDGVPIYPQLTVEPVGIGPHMGVADWSGRFTGKVLTVQNTHDSMIWPSESRYEEGTDRWAIRWTEGAEHVPPGMSPINTVPMPSTSIVSYTGSIEQSLYDLVAWVEEGIRPTETTYSLEPGQKIELPPTAAERGGIQPVVQAAANGGARAEVKVGEPVTLTLEAEVPPGAGTIVKIEWDFDGTGTWPELQAAIDGTQSKVSASVTHAYDRPGTYFPAARVSSHREGDVNATLRLVQNLGRARVVVG
jgi:hypothetical protein